LGPEEEMLQCESYQRKELDEETAAVDTVEKFKRQLGQFGCLDTKVVLTQTGVF